jgi:hypothetical protein
MERRLRVEQAWFQIFSPELESSNNTSDKLPSTEPVSLTKKQKRVPTSKGCYTAK